jgi:triosephosphate isomerase
MEKNLKNPPLFIANWKMNMPLTSARDFLDKHHQKLELVAQENNAQIALCPSFLALDYFCQKTENSVLKIGAQDCSEHQSGAYTGQVDASSLAFMGCSYGIVGHSERRQYCGETDEMVAEKMVRLIENGITPIVCVGETEQEFAGKKTKEALTRQIAPIIARLTELQSQEPGSGALQGNREQSSGTKIIIAYEPVYAIGAGVAPDTAHLTDIFGWLQETVHKSARSAFEKNGLRQNGQAQNRIEFGKPAGQDALSPADIRLVYGGSVTEENAQALLAIPHVSGLLIGGASLDFQKFQNIVFSNSRRQIISN